MSGRCKQWHPVLKCTCIKCCPPLKQVFRLIKNAVNYIIDVTQFVIMFFIVCFIASSILYLINMILDSIVLNVADYF